MINRSQSSKQEILNICGSSTFGRYPKISIEKTYNMFASDNFMVPYGGYAIMIQGKDFLNGVEGRGIFTSIKFNRLVVVVDRNVFLIDISFNQTFDIITNRQVLPIGQLGSSTGTVYISENNKPQILISDNINLYVYDPAVNSTIQVVSNLDFIPGFITFHDTYFICAAKQDKISGATNTWRLSDQNDGRTWPNTSANVGLLQTKPDNTQAVLRFPSKGNMIFVIGENVTESWFDTGAQLFPYQRTNQFNIDYGCLNPATVAYMDEIVVWLAQNEKSGPIILYSDGGMPEKITTDGIDYLFSTLQNPADSQGFLYRQDGHLFYHINFYSDNLSLFYDFNTKKFYHACDQNLNYYIASQVAFFKNQYYFVSRNDGNLYAIDTQFYTYQSLDFAGNIVNNEIPRIRTCKNVRLPSQEYFIANDAGFTIETGETDYQFQTANNIPIATTPRVDLSLSFDGGASFSSDMPYVLNPVGKRRNRLMWWQLGAANDLVCQFKFWGMGRFVATDGILNIRQ